MAKVLSPPEPQVIPEIRSEGIDALRALLALWVLMFHVLNWSVVTQGPEASPEILAQAAAFLAQVFQSAGETHPAVLTFIVLSGYCIHRNSKLLSKNQTAGHRIRFYSIRRSARIIPVYLLGIVAGVIGFMVSSSTSLQQTQALSHTQGIDGLGLLEKAFGVSVFIPHLHTLTFEGNAPLHTVMTEIWLYVAYPVLLLGIAAHKGMRIVWLILSAVWILGTEAITFMPSLQPWWHNGSLAGFLLYWWIGAQAVETGFSQWLKRHFLTLMICWLAATLCISLADIHTPLLVECRKVVFALLTAYGIARLDNGKTPLFLRPLALLGVAGYSIYAFHAPLVYSLLISGFPWWAVFLASIAFGGLSFILVEHPLTALGRKLTA